MSPIAITLIFLAFAIVMFVTEKLPLAVTSMVVCVGLVLTKVLSVKDAFAGFVDSNVILFVAMFVVGGAFFETGMAYSVGGLVTRFAKTERQLIVAVMMVTGIMSGFLSNTGTAAVVIPVVIGIAAKSGFARSKLLMTVPIAAAMGGNLSLIGAPGNMIGQAALQKMGLSFGFFEYALVGAPILIAGILYFALFGYKLLPEKSRNAGDTTFDQQIDYSTVPSWKKKLSLIVLVLTILAMIFEKQIGIKLAISGCIGALVLVISGVISEKQAYKAIDMPTIFLFGGTLSLATAIEKTGAGKLIANTVINSAGKDVSPFVLLVVVFTIACILTNFMSNTATTALLVPVSISIATGMGADPRAVIMATVIGGSCAYSTPIGMPANTMVLGPGGYNFTDYVKAGFPLQIIAAIVSFVLLPIFFPFFPK